MNVKKSTLAAKRYSLKEDYQRFDHKNALVVQGEWNPEYEHLSIKNWKANRIAKLEKGSQGFTRLDWAYYSAGAANSNATRFINNVPNSGGNAWDKLPRVWFGDEQFNIPDWEGDPVLATKAIKKIARLAGADDVGICMLDRRWVYSHYYDRDSKKSYPIHFSDEAGYSGITKPCSIDDRSQVIPADMKYAIVFIHEMDKQGIAAAPTLSHMATTMLAYSQISFTAITMAEFIRALGYNAIPSANCTALNIPLAIDAGLGELGRMAKLIHPVYGPRCRISKVITDLPLNIDTPISFGVEQFCKACKKCAEVCPSHAIPEGDRSYIPVGNYSHSSVLQWQLDHASCRKYWVKSGTNCGLCLNACPYNKKEGLVHNIVKSVISLTPLFNQAFISMDNALGYGKPISANYFWDSV